MPYYIALDIGGTQMRAACYAGDSHDPVNVKRIPTQDNQEETLERLLGLIESVWPTQGKVASIGVAIPGPTDPYAGIIIETPNIHGWTNLPLRRLLQERFHIPVALGNDANLAALGEWKYGAGRGHHNMLYLTISTGIGGGVISNDQLLLGARGLAAELGHITVLPDGPMCGCGQSGHLEAVASGPAIARWVMQEIANGKPSSLPSDRQLSARNIAEAADGGDALAIEALQRAGCFLGKAIADFLHIFNPTAIILGGGVSQSMHLLIEPLKTSMEQRLMSKYYAEGLTLTRAELGDDAGLVGALVLAQSLDKS